ncbi:hypothetical protein RRG08_058719 [Elysia crispata]|uniref:Uncharacterized protein n=1 Tax=Elysia crispata TaxID=231223 RepID=A0AAE0YW86_9GAST|nr:hypothetical protein RRG08_058719 [Elysia crispata]
MSVCLLVYIHDRCDFRYSSMSVCLLVYVHDRCDFCYSSMSVCLLVYVHDRCDFRYSSMSVWLLTNEALGEVRQKSFNNTGNVVRQSCSLVLFLSAIIAQGRPSFKFIHEGRLVQRQRFSVKPSIGCSRAPGQATGRPSLGSNSILLIADPSLYQLSYPAISENCGLSQKSVWFASPDWANNGSQSSNLSHGYSQSSAGKLFGSSPDNSTILHQLGRVTVLQSILIKGFLSSEDDPSCSTGAGVWLESVRESFMVPHLPALSAP